MQAAPHANGSLSAAPAPTHLAPHRWLGAAHDIPHASAMQVAVPPAGAGHAVHAGPHVAGSVDATHAPPHLWNWGLHVKEHCAVVHALVAFATTGHLALHPPQLSTLVIGSTHWAPQFSGAAGVHPLVHWNDWPAGAQSGAAAAHAALQAPQLLGFDRSVSQPSAAVALQSE